MKMIPLDDVRFIVEHWHDLLSYTWNTRDYMETLHKKLDTTKSIDPEEIIEQMLEKETDKANRSSAWAYESGRANALEELLQKFKS